MDLYEIDGSVDIDGPVGYRWTCRMQMGLWDVDGLVGYRRTSVGVIDQPACFEIVNNLIKGCLIIPLHILQLMNQH